MRTYRTVNLNILWFLIALNVLIFVITLLRTEAVVSLLGLTPVLLPEQPWTIISSMFVHGGFGHILFNMIALYFLGSFLIRAAGEKGFLAIFFLGGLVGNALYVLLGYLALWGAISPSLGHPFTPAVGASGGIFALAGALAVIVPRVPVFIFFIPIPMPLWVATIILVLLSFVFSNIAWQAHIGGLVLGLIAGLILRRSRRIYLF